MGRSIFARAAVCLALTAVVVAGIAGCATSTDGPDLGVETQGQEFPVALVDDIGREVTVTVEPLRIVSLAPANTEIVAELGLLDRVVGVTSFDDYPPEVSEIQVVGDFMAPNVEAVAATSPDLVLATGGIQAGTISQLEDMGAVVIAVDPVDLESLYASIRMVGAATGTDAEAEALVDGMTSDVADIEAAAAERAPVTAFVEIAQDPLFTTGSGTLIDDLLVRAGGVNTVQKEGYIGYSVEQLLEDDPEVYLATEGSMSDPSTLGERPGYDSLSAVAAGRVYILDDNLVSRPGPRVVEGLAQIYAALHVGEE